MDEREGGGEEGETNGISRTKTSLGKMCSVINEVRDNEFCGEMQDKEE